MDPFSEQSLIVIPSAEKMGKLHCIRPESGDGDFTFVNNSRRSRINSQGKIAWVEAGHPSVGFKNGKSVLVLEPERCNYFAYPIDIGLDNYYYWTHQASKAILDSTTEGQELVSNGNLDSPTGWTLGPGGSIAGGVATFLGEEEYSYIKQTLQGLQVGITYIIRVTVTENASGLSLTIAGATSAITAYLSSGVIEWRMKIYNKSNDDLIIEVPDYGYCIIDSISVKQIEGYEDPEGMTGALKLVETVQNTSHAIKVSVPVIANTFYTISCHFKKAERDIVYIRTGSYFSYFNLTTGQCVLSATQHTCSIEQIGGYYRCSVTYVPTTTSSFIYFGTALVPGSPSFAGNVTSGLYLYGAQLENSEYPTSLIFDGTLGDISNRSKDILSLINLQLKGLIGTSWSLFIDINDFPDPQIGGPVIYLRNNFGTPEYSFLLVVDRRTGFYDFINNSYQWLTPVTGPTKLCITYHNGTMKCYQDGVKNPTEYTPAIPLTVINTLEWNGEVRHSANGLILMPRCLTDDEAIELTG